MIKKKITVLGALIIILMLTLNFFNNQKRDRLIKKETSKVYIGMSKSNLIEIYGNAHSIVSSKDFSYIPENIEKYYYSRDIDLYPFIEKDVVVQVIISIDKNNNKISKIVVSKD